MKRLRLVVAGVLAAMLLVPAGAFAQEALVVSITNRQTDYLWTGEPATITGRATFTDGNVAALKPLTVETRPYPFKGAFTATGQLVTDVNGRFTYSDRPTKNVEVRVRGEAGQTSPAVIFRVFASPQEGDLLSLAHGRQKAVETSLVPTGFELAKAYLYFCKPKAKRCSFAKTGKAKIRGQRLTATASFKPPRKYAAKKYTVFFRYVPKAGWGDSNSAERKRPKKTLPADDS